MIYEDIGHRIQYLKLSLFLKKLICIITITIGSQEWLIKECAFYLINVSNLL